MKRKLPPYTNSQIAFLIDEHIHVERDRHILKRCLIDGVHFEPLAEEVDMSVRRVKAIVYREEQRLLRYL